MPPARFTLYAATAGVIAMSAFSVLAGPPPLWAASLVLLGYVAFFLAGVFFLRWRVFVDALVHGPRGARGVVLTFDDGPHPKWTPLFLHALAARGATATFFVIGRKAADHPDLVRAIVDGGHAIGLHSHEHDRLFALRNERRIRDDLERGLLALQAITGQRPVLFRPPVGHSTPTIARVAESLNLLCVGWTVGARDGLSWTRPTDVAARIRRELRDGAIVLLHDSPERGDREPAALRALPAIFEAIEAAGLDVVDVRGWV